MKVKKLPSAFAWLIYREIGGEITITFAPLCTGVYGLTRSRVDQEGKMSESLTYEAQGRSATHTESGGFDIESHREELEAIAQSDLPANWIAETILEVYDE